VLEHLALGTTSPNAGFSREKLTMIRLCEEVQTEKLTMLTLLTFS
jgi:hypothetical protein